MGAAAQLKPFVVGNAVAVGVDADHYNARFGRGIGSRAKHLHCVAVDLEIIFALDIGYRMVETEHDISAESAQRHHAGALVADKLTGRSLENLFAAHAVGNLGNQMDKLSGSRNIVENFRDKRRVGPR